jgi:hypothetical protein
LGIGIDVECGVFATRTVEVDGAKAGPAVLVWCRCRFVAEGVQCGCRAGFWTCWMATLDPDRKLVLSRRWWGIVEGVCAGLAAHAPLEGLSLKGRSRLARARGLAVPLSRSSLASRDEVPVEPVHRKHRCTLASGHGLRVRSLCRSDSSSPCGGSSWAKHSSPSHAWQGRWNVSQSLQVRHATISLGPRTKQRSPWIAQEH